MNPREEDCRVHMATEVVEDEDDRVAADLMSSVKGLFFPFTMKCGGVKVPSANTTGISGTRDERSCSSQCLATGCCAFPGTRLTTSITSHLTCMQ
eukprot:CAMPEP_0117658574 /NCGR_PEP_ID=MMETSP0804-20121206/5934_1 /TAXON_ID=1074897 /ORGANISM="Tetraselmis astigmatica, Strain CCMP880" /LENGTH=94 /DNA_ID=CAMNT_0005465099 /DNA_START=539 /DNA_END=820 /DNA_ORIENTATION=-